MTEPRPCSPTEAVSRARRLLAHPSNATTGYVLGTGDYRPRTNAGILFDLPWTTGDDGTGSDCAGFAICWCYKLQRHRSGFNRGSWATITDDLNCDSAIEDSEHDRDLFVAVDDEPQPGDLLVYPTIPKIGDAGPWIGHVAIVLDCPWSAWITGRYDTLRVAQCCGGPGRMPAVIATDGSVWRHHDQTWPTHVTRVLRAKP